MDDIHKLTVFQQIETHLLFQVLVKLLRHLLQHVPHEREGGDLLADLPQVFLRDLKSSHLLRIIQNFRNLLHRDSQSAKNQYLPQTFDRLPVIHPIGIVLHSTAADKPFLLVIAQHSGGNMKLL